ncbi:O-antigen polysaccharide polymerase Wzy [Alkalibaculum sp. M08DMB]|uniref:O-antigen polysaccharide polymerase Wzy n=1 Tax=Alkalibaculum sporogenes TaxID=2655001 RepID=A0A6A7KBP8_9FIRM|nr:O-antigen polymerase [Alkalibaculum sporogenes]MPW26970.1 O-antigen polysaccharide polymerase Wzy [Alkalibaculum sporogenes]
MGFVVHNFMFWVIYVSVIIISTTFVLNSNIILNKFSIGSVVYYSLIIFAFIGYPAIYYKIIPYYVNSGLTNNLIISKMFIISSLVIIQFFLGYYVCSKYIDRFRIKVNKSNVAKIQELSKSLWLIIFITCIGVLIYYLGRVPNIALFEAIKGSTSIEIAQSRSEMTNAFDKYHRFRLFFKTILPFMSTISLLEMIRTKKKFWILSFIISFISVCFALLIDTQKAPIIWYVISIVAVILVYYNRKIDLKFLIKITILMLVVLFISYIVFMGSKIHIETVISPIRRGLTGQIIPFYHYIEIFPDLIPFQYGKTFPNPRSIFPFENFNYTVEIANIVNKQREGITSSVPTAFWGELWINFGWYGIFVIPIIFGAFVYVLHYIFNRNRERTTIEIALMVWVALELKNLAFTGFSGYLFPFDAFFIVTISLVFYLSSIRFRIRKN